MANPLLVDVDTGVDDALALLFLARHPELEILGVTCVAGNTDVDRVVRNTLDVLHLAGAGSVPVARGADRPLIEPRRPASGFHGEDGLAGYSLPLSPHPASPLPAVEFMKWAIDESADPVTLLALGPLTNVALFLRLYPERASRLERIVFMGGSAGVGNATAVAEFNIWHDPEAAAIVLDAPVPVIMYGLDVFYEPAVGVRDIAALGDSADAALRLAAALLSHSVSLESDDPRLAFGGLLGDAGAACYVADPRLVVTGIFPSSIELAPGAGRGQTIVDRRNSPGESEQHFGSKKDRRMEVAMTVDAHDMEHLFLETIRKEVAL